MAYSDEQRPEAQFGNQSRNSLNIQQPGETDSYDVFFSDPNRWKDNSTSFSLGDVLPTMGKGVAQSVRGTGEMARGLGDAMIQSPVKTGARILNEFSRMGLPGVATVQDIFVGGSKGADEVIDTLPDGKNAVTDTVGKGLKVTGKAVSGGAKASDEWLTGKMSPGAQRALNTPMTEGYDDSAVWVAKGVNLIGALVPDMVAGGVTKKLGDVTLRKVLTAGLEKKYIAAGMQPERATALAAEAVDKKMPDFFQAGLITHSTVSAQGRSAMAAADAVLNADYSELAKSPKFQQTFLSIDADPQHAQLTDRQKMDLAKERVADEVRAQLATDPELLAVNAMAAKLGDAQLLNLAMRGTAKTVKAALSEMPRNRGRLMRRRVAIHAIRKTRHCVRPPEWMCHRGRAWLTQRSKVQPLVLQWGHHSVRLPDIVENVRRQMKQQCVRLKAFLRTNRLRNPNRLIRWHSIVNLCRG